MIEFVKITDINNIRKPERKTGWCRLNQRKQEIYSRISLHLLVKAKISPNGKPWPHVQTIPSSMSLTEEIKNNSYYPGLLK